MYDATDYAVNTFNVPVVAYSGGNDAQKQAADAMAAAMLKEGLTLEHIVGPNTGACLRATCATAGSGPAGSACRHGA